MSLSSVLDALRKCRADRAVLMGQLVTVHRAEGRWIQRLAAIARRVESIVRAHPEVGSADDSDSDNATDPLSGCDGMESAASGRSVSTMDRWRASDHGTESNRLTESASAGTSAGSDYSTEAGGGRSDRPTYIAETIGLQWREYLIWQARHRTGPPISWKRWLATGKARLEPLLPAGMPWPPPMPNAAAHACADAEAHEERPTAGTTRVRHCDLRGVVVPAGCPHTACPWCEAPAWRYDDNDNDSSSSSSRSSSSRSSSSSGGSVHTQEA